MSNIGGMSVANPQASQQDNQSGLLKALLDIAIPNASANTQSQASQIEQKTSQQSQQGPYQQGVAKALKSLGEQHATEAVQQGVDPVDIQNHEVMNQGQPQVDPVKIISTLLAMNNPNNGDTIQSQTPIQQQAQQIITPEHRTILGNILNTIGNVTGFNAMNSISEQGAKALQLDNLSKAQGILQQTPEAKYQLAGAEELTQSAKQKQLANAGETPMQKSDIISATTAAQQKQIESKKAELEAEKSNLQALIKTQSDTISHPAALLMGGQGLKDLHKSIQDSFDNIKKLQGEMDSLSGSYAGKTGAASSSGKPNITPEQAKAILRARKVKGY